MLLDPSTDDYTILTSGNIFRVESDEARIYFYSKPVEDYMRTEFNEHWWQFIFPSERIRGHLSSLG